MSLALSTLIFEWRRYLAAVIALAVAGLLVLAMSGMFMGMAKSFTNTIDRSLASISWFCRRSRKACLPILAVSPAVSSRCCISTRKWPKSCQ